MPDFFELPDLFAVFSWLLRVAFMVVPLLLLFLILRHQHGGAASARPAGVFAPNGQFLPAGSSDAPPATWQARVFGAAVDLWGEFGTITVTNASLAFTPDQSSQPAWVFPVRSLRARHRGLIKLGQGDINLWLPNGTKLRLVVSHEHINRAVNNQFKYLRENREAHSFLSTLAANGARMTAPA